MAGLKQTTAKLARYSRNWEKLLAKSAAGQKAGAAPVRAGRLSEGTGFGSNPGNLRMWTYVPETCRPGAPLVIVLHGCTQTADGYHHGAGWSTLADRHGFALLLPEQQRANNPNNCFNWFLPGDTKRGGGEAQSIRQMIEHVLVEHGLDRSRVFVTGLSAGGAMAAAMLATYPEVFAGGAIIAGLPYGAAGNVQEALDSMFQGKSLPAKAWGDRVRAASQHRGPWPKVSIWHGGADSTVLPVNAEELVKQWTDVHGLPPKPAAEETVNGHPRRVWRNAAGREVIETYAIAGMAHGTPIAAGSGAETCGTAGPFILEAGISSSYQIAKFWGLLDNSGAESRTAGARSERGDFDRPAAAHSISATESPGARRPALGASTRPGASASPRPQAARERALDPQSVITKALRSAGLMKR